MNLYIHTLGCKVNQYESQAISEIFVNNGFRLSAPSDADVIIVNSCSVTAESDRKTRQTVRRLKLKNQNCTLILCGCMSSAFPEKSYDIQEADIVIGNNNYNKIYNTYLDYVSGGKKRVLAVEEHKKGEKYCTPSVSKFNERTRAYIKIEDGCDRFCSYCIIPYARGRVRSRCIEEIYSEALALSKSNYKEIVLVGINLTAYGKDTGESLADVVERVAEINGIERIRFGSMEIDQISDETLKRLAKCEKFCPQFHLSLQSGCDKTLKSMNRHYDTDFYLNFVEKIKEKFDNPSITTDIMVGFAGETESDFLESVEFARKISFAKMHVFSYSKRVGTKAYSFPNQVENREKERRSKIMIEAANELEKKFLATQVGLTQKVLFETEENGMWYGYTKNYTRVKAQSDIDIQNAILDVKLTAPDGDLLIGEIIK